MIPAIQTPQIERDYERLNGTVQVQRVYDWRKRCYVVRQVIDLGRRPPTPYQPANGPFVRRVHD